MLGNGLLRTLIIVSSLIGLPACNGGAPKPPSPDASFDNWRSYQADLARYLDGEIGRPNNMRVAPATIQYPIGTVLRKGSSSEVSASCRYAVASNLPEPVPGPDIPKTTAKRNFKLDVSPGPLIQRIVEDVSSLGLNVDRGAALEAVVSEVKVQILDERQTNSIIRDPTCLSDLEGLEVSVIRGYVYAKYAVKAGAALEAGANAEVFDTELFHILYKDANSFEVTDAELKPRFYILADGFIDRKIVLGSGITQSISESGCTEKIEISYSGKPITREDKLYMDSFPSEGKYSSCENWAKYMEWCRQEEGCMDELIKEWYGLE